MFSTSIEIVKSVADLAASVECSELGPCQRATALGAIFECWIWFTSAPLVVPAHARRHSQWSQQREYEWKRRPVHEAREALAEAVSVERFFCQQGIASGEW